jgi:virulence factor
MVDFNRRYAPVYVAGRETFGPTGATFCVAQKNRPGSEYRATFENAIHMVDLLRWYCGGEPVDVTAHSAGDDPWQEDGTTAIVRFDTGNTGVLMARTAGAWNEKLDAYGLRTFRRGAGAGIGLDHRRRRHHDPKPEL